MNARKLARLLLTLLRQGNPNTEPHESLELLDVARKITQVWISRIDLGNMQEKMRLIRKRRYPCTARIESRLPSVALFSRLRCLYLTMRISEVALPPVLNVVGSL